MIFRRKKIHRSRKEGSRSIYALIDPRDYTVRYIGCAIDIDERLGGHLRDRSDTPKCRWLSDLRRDGLLPDVAVLETGCSFSGAFNSESFWIQKMLRAGAPLTNVVSAAERGKFSRKSSSAVDRIPSCKGTKLLCVRKMVLGVGREVVALRAGLSNRVYGLAESGDVVKYSTAESILEAVNDLLVEQGQAEVVLADLGWVPLEW